MNTKEKKPTIESEYYYRLRDIAKLSPKNITLKLVDFLGTVKPKKKRTEAQNKAMHKNFAIIAEKLNDSGLDMRKLLKQHINIPWTTDSVKEYIWKPIMKAMFQKESTTELEKNSAEIEQIHKVIMRELGEKHGIEYHEFPFDPEKRKEMEESLLRQSAGIPYPKEDIDPTKTPF